MTAVSISASTTSLRRRPSGLDGAVYALGMRMAAWARTHSARRASDRQSYEREVQWRAAADAYAEATRQADLYRGWASR